MIKKLHISLGIFLLFFSIQIFAFTDSNLPIVIINTDLNTNTGEPLPIVDEPKVMANMHIIYRPDGSRNYLTDKDSLNFQNYAGRIGIEIRGSSSQDLPKNSYSLTTYLQDDNTKNNVSILGMPKENDWILFSLAFDPSLIRDCFSYLLYSKMGNYSPRGKYCELFVNGDYRGLYFLWKN